jgi:hypothetical protein
MFFETFKGCLKVPSTADTYGQVSGQPSNSRFTDKGAISFVFL